MKIFFLISSNSDKFEFHIHSCSYCLIGKSENDLWKYPYIIICIIYWCNRYYWYSSKSISKNIHLWIYKLVGVCRMGANENEKATTAKNRRFFWVEKSIKGCFWECQKMEHERKLIIQLQDGLTWFRKDGLTRFSSEPSKVLKKIWNGSTRGGTGPKTFKLLKLEPSWARIKPRA